MGPVGPYAPTRRAAIVGELEVRPGGSRKPPAEIAPNVGHEGQSTISEQSRGRNTTIVVIAISQMFVSFLWCHWYD